MRSPFLIEETHIWRSRSVSRDVVSQIVTFLIEETHVWRSRDIYGARGWGKTQSNVLNRFKIAHYISTPTIPIKVTTTPITAAIDGTSCSRKIPSTMPPVTSCVAIRLA